MQEYIVSARKYRPMTFNTVVGQSSLTTTLKHMKIDISQVGDWCWDYLFIVDINGDIIGVSCHHKLMNSYFELE